MAYRDESTWFLSRQFFENWNHMSNKCSEFKYRKWKGRLLSVLGLLGRIHVISEQTILWEVKSREYHMWWNINYFTGRKHFFICSQPRFLNLLGCLEKTLSSEENAKHKVVPRKLDKVLISVSVKGYYLYTVLPRCSTIFKYARLATSTLLCFKWKIVNTCEAKKLVREGVVDLGRVRPWKSEVRKMKQQESVGRASHTSVNIHWICSLAVQKPLLTQS